MAMMARGLGPVRHVSVQRCQLGGVCGGARALLLPELRGAGSTSSPVVSASWHGRNAARGTTRPYSAAAAAATTTLGGITPPTTTRENPRETSASSLRASTSGSTRRRSTIIGSSTGLDDTTKGAPTSAGRLNPARATAAAAQLLCGRGDQQLRRAGVFCSARASREWRSVGGGVASVQLAGFRTSASVLGPAAGSGNDTKTGDAPQGEPAYKGSTVKGGNPACRNRDADRDKDRDRDGSFTQMRERIRQGRLDASEDAKDWIREKRDDMNTMKETLRDARQELRDARRDGRLGEELSEQAKESSGRLQVLWRQYGAVGIGTYFGIYFGSIAVFYVVYDYGVLTSLPSGGTAVIEHMQEWMKNAPEWARSYSDRLFGAMVEDHRARSLVLAWATCKVIEPLRLLGAIAITPRMARALGRAPAK